MPINSPRRLTSGPPLLPTLMGASVCSQFGMSSGTPSLGSTRLLELRMPRLTERANWMAANFSPGRLLSLSRATSLFGSLATTLAV